MGTLRVFVNSKLEFAKSGSQGDKWFKADLKIQETATTVSTVFESERASLGLCSTTVEPLLTPVAPY